VRAVLNRLSGVLKKRPAEPESADCRQYSHLARFIFQSGHYRKLAPARPKPGAFLPNPSKLQTSAIWRDDLPEQEIWKIGDLLGTERSEQPPARADFDIAVVTEAKLTIEADPVPHPRHVNLCKWPVDKAEQKSIALLSCARSILMLRPVSERVEP
jgi:hypothetical protein